MLILPTQGKDFLRRCCTYFGIGGALILELTKFEAIPKTDHMFIGDEESEERKVGVNPKRFTFSYFNNMDFHTEFVRRFYKQMIFEGVQQIENELQ